ncbi:MAG: phosphotransferase [Acidimicrobiia bacterium]
MSEVPSPDLAVPRIVTTIAGSHPITPMWRNQIGGLTFAVEDPAGRRFVKWAPNGPESDARAEAARMEWVGQYSRAPRVIDVLDDPESDTTVLVTQALAGESAVSERWKSDPSTAAQVIGRGLRFLHDHAPVDTCPYSWSVEDRLAYARQKVDAGAAPPSRWPPEYAEDLSLTDALAIAATPPAIDVKVVCHGDACSPNTIIDRGEWSGHVDLGALGVADRWADLAIATWSLEWNYGPGWEPTLLDAYGIDPDPERCAYYRLLWELA